MQYIYIYAIYIYIYMYIYVCIYIYIYIQGKFPITDQAQLLTLGGSINDLFIFRNILFIIPFINYCSVVYRLISMR